MVESRQQAVYTVAEVADLLRCSRSEVYRLVHAGELRHLKVRSMIRITAEQFDEFKAQHEGQPEEAVDGDEAVDGR